MSHMMISPTRMMKIQRTVVVDVVAVTSAGEAVGVDAAITTT
jgi:hypothetical protein